MEGLVVAIIVDLGGVEGDTITVGHGEVANEGKSGDESRDDVEQSLGLFVLVSIAHSVDCT